MVEMPIKVAAGRQTMDVERGNAKKSASKQIIKEEILGDRPMVLEQIKENDENMPPNGDRAPSVKMSASNEKKVPEVSTQDEKNVFKKLAEIFTKNKRQGQSAVSFDEIFEVFPDMDKLYLEAVLAVIEQKGNIFIDQESKTILMI